jgi:hypothetical protein
LRDVAERPDHRVRIALLRELVGDQLLRA